MSRPTPDAQESPAEATPAEPVVALDRSGNGAVPNGTSDGGGSDFGANGGAANSGASDRPAEPPSATPPAEPPSATPPAEPPPAEPPSATPPATPTEPLATVPGASSAATPTASSASPAAGEPPTAPVGTVGGYGASPSTGRRWGRWLVLFAGFWLLTSAWSLATPLFGSPDEPSHAFRAAAVVRGEILPPDSDEASGGYGVLEVPTSFQQSAATIGCYTFQAEVTADCMPDVPDDPTLVEAGSGAARYNPVYYAAVGWPSLLWTDQVGLFAMRIVSAALCSAFLASAVCSAIGGRRGRLAVIGVLLAATPMAIFLGGVVNPNSVEIAAAISLWAAGLRLVTGTGGLAQRETDALWRRAALAGSAMVLTRGLSPAWLAIIVLTCLLVAKKDALLPQLRRAKVWIWIALVVVCTLGSVGWTLYSGASEIPRTTPGDATFLGAINGTLQMFDRRMLEYVGLFGWTDTPAPALTVIVWAGLVGLLVVLAAAAARRREAIVLIALAVVTVVLPLILEAMQYNSLGLFWQSRYTLPVAAGIPILAAISLGGRRGTAALSTRRFATIAVLAMAAAQALAFGHTLIRYQSGLGKGLNPFEGVWHPEVGSATVLGMAVGGLVVLAVTVLVLRAETDGPLADATDDDPASGTSDPVSGSDADKDPRTGTAGSTGAAGAPATVGAERSRTGSPGDRTQRLDPLPAYSEGERPTERR